MRAIAVIDLGFGDSGKGLLTDYLVRRTAADAVVRFNGGAQASHNVITPDGRHHAFSQAGAGSFVPGVKTFLGREVVVHPTGLLSEEVALRHSGVSDLFARLSIHGGARLIAPPHQALGRLRELARGEGRHGSCGVGFGEAVADHLAAPAEALLALDLGAAAVVRHKLGALLERKRAEAKRLAEGCPRRAAAAELAIFEDPTWVEPWVAQAQRLAGLVLEAPEFQARLRRSRRVVFEGAQGVLLDEAHGFHPHTTWSDCTFGGVGRALAECGEGRAPLVRVGVLRSHAVRHGAGPLPTESAEVSAAVLEAHNRPGAFQGAVRHGWFDAVLGRHALAAVGGVDALALTHVDAIARLSRFRLCAGYRIEGRAVTEVRQLSALPPGLERQAALCARLRQAEPVFDDRQPSDERAALGAIERALGRPLAVISRGPTAGDVELRGSLGA